MSCASGGTTRQPSTADTSISTEPDTTYGEPDANPFIAGVVRALGGAGITIALIIVVLNQVFTLDIVNSSSGPFQISTVTGPMAGALGLLALAILVGGARIVMNQMGSGGGL